MNQSYQSWTNALNEPLNDIDHHKMKSVPYMCITSVIIFHVYY